MRLNAIAESRPEVGSYRPQCIALLTSHTYILAFFYKFLTYQMYTVAHKNRTLHTRW